MPVKQFATFTIDEHLFGINVLLVREINPHTNFTPVDLAPEFVRGLMNLRGQIVTIIDPAVRLGIGQRDITPRSRCMVLKTVKEIEEREDAGELVADLVNDNVGLLVDAIGDMVSADTRNIEPPPANIGDIDGRFMSGVFRLEGRLMMVLRTGEVLKS